MTTAEVAVAEATVAGNALGTVLALLIGALDLAGSHNEQVGKKEEILKKKRGVEEMGGEREREREAEGSENDRG